jgi:hypothetical protein
MTLQRLVLDFRSGEMVVRCLSSNDGGSNPGTLKRRMGVSELVRAAGVQEALEALDNEASVECVGTSGFTQREDDLLATASPDAAKRVKRA